MVTRLLEGVKMVYPDAPVDDLIDDAEFYEDALKAAARAAVGDAPRHIHLMAGSLLSSAQDAAASGLKVASDRLNDTARALEALVGAGLGAAQLGAQAVQGGLYDLADGFMLRPAINVTEDQFSPGASSGYGYCFPPWRSPEWLRPEVGCPEGYELAPLVGKCVRKVYRKVGVCYKGPVCMSPYKATGAPECFEDKVMEVCAVGGTSAGEDDGGFGGVRCWVAAIRKARRTPAKKHMNAHNNTTGNHRSAGNAEAGHLPTHQAGTRTPPVWQLNRPTPNKAGA